MTTIRFSKEEFEKVLASTQYVFECDGVRYQEYHYHATVKTGVCIEVNSSVGVDGFAMDTGENSIRVWLADEDGKPLAKKDRAYVTRVAGWERRLVDVIEKTANSFEESPACPKCGGVMVKRTRKSDGNEFWGCKNFPKCNGTRNIGQSYTPDATVVKVVEQVSKKFTPSKYQQAIFDWMTTNSGKNLVVEALAGSGKTTTGVEMLNLIPSNLDVLFVAFNKHIATELQKRAPDHVRCSTFHSMGYGAIRNAYGNVQVDEDKLDKILCDVLDRYIHKNIFPVIKQIVSLIKANLSDVEETTIDELCDHYGIEMNGEKPLIYDAVRLVMARSIENISVIDYDDMCYLPVFNKLAMRKYDVVFIDEAQDLNKNQIELALNSVKEGGKIIAVGDRHQSLYGFRGADAEAIPNLINLLSADTLPLSITYRCPKSVVELCNQKFPEIPLEATDWAAAGKVIDMGYNDALNSFSPNDMVLCRTNAPLVQPAFELIRKGIKAVIRGRDIGKGLNVLIHKMKANGLNDLLYKLEEYKIRESGKLFGLNKNNQAQSIVDKVETIMALSDGCSSISCLEDKINIIFSDNVEGVVFSSVHKAKGLEAKNVYILSPELMPHPMAKKDWEKQQEQNIMYVAYTRSLDQLIFVR